MKHDFFLLGLIQKKSLMSRVVVIPKEGKKNEKGKKIQVGLLPKEGRADHLSFGMTMPCHHGLNST